MKRLELNEVEMKEWAIMSFKYNEKDVMKVGQQLLEVWYI